MNNIISLCDYRQQKIEAAYDEQIEDEWNLLDNMITSILISEKAKILSVVDNCDTTTITLTIWNRKEEDPNK